MPPVTWTRLNAHYRGAVELARLLLQLRTPEIHPGGVLSAGLTIDMAALFETFVRTALRDALSATPAELPGGNECPPLHLDAARRVPLRPDLSYWPARRCIFVGDVKYKRDPGPGRQVDLYQLLAYATGTQLPRATLVYADGPPEPQSHLVEHGAVQLAVRHLDLAQSPSAILDQIAGLANAITTGASGPHVSAARLT